ncbi:MAG: hypothetical protein IKZ88_08490 [Neisseriaceae bacterium]|nr:hypothetical protein [Neisseriaceae bacterium]
MIIRFGGGTSGIVEYLETGQKSGREYSRDELDKRVILSGEIRYLDEVLNQFPKDDESQHYIHITLSFKERKIDEETLRAIDKEFRQFVFAATGRDDEFYYYSEAHLPKIKRLKDMNGDDYERFPHIHIVIPQYNLYTGKRDDPIGLHNPIIPYIDAFQEYINAKYNLASPKDNRRLFKLGKDGAINRTQLKNETAYVKNYISSYTSRQAVKNEIFNLIRADKTISSVEDLAEVLKDLGEVKIRDSKKFGQKYINFRLNGYPDKKAINLKDNVFLDNYLKTRSLKETQEYAMGSQNQELLQEWYSKKAFEHRFIMAASPKERDIYFHHADEATQQQMLQQKIAIHQKLLQEMDYTEPVEKSPPRTKIPAYLRNPPAPSLDQVPHINEVPHLNEVRHMNEIPHMNELPVMGVDNPPPFYVEYEVITDEKENTDERERSNHQRDDREQSSTIDIRHIAQRATFNQSGQPMPNLSGGSGNAQRSGAGKQDDRTNLLHRLPFDDLDANTQKQGASVFNLRHKGRVKKQRELTSPTQIEQMWQEISDDYQAKTVAAKNKINAVDCRVMLDICNVKYGLNTEDFNIAINAQGSDRIMIGDKPLNAAEFLRQYMNLSWRETDRMLDYSLQQQKIGVSQRNVVSGLMWARFNREEAVELAHFQQLRRQYRADKQKIFDKTRYLRDSRESKAQATVRRKYLTEQRDYQLQELQDKYRPLFKNAKKPNERYCEWLHKQAVSGSLNAWLELQRVYPHYKEKVEDKEKLSFIAKDKDAIYIPHRFPPDFGLSVVIQKNGTIDYKDTHGNTLISNTYGRILVREKTAENIEKALQMAQAKFGKGGFEIINANLRDLSTIQAAVDKTQIAVSIREQTSTVRIERGR